MRVKFLKYGKTIRNAQATEHAEVSVELEREDSAEEAMDKAKAFIEDSLTPKTGRALKASLGEHLKAKTELPHSGHFNGA